MKKMLSAIAVSVALFSAGAMAAETATKEATAPMTVQTTAVQQKEMKDVIQVAEQGYNAVINIQRARLALFNGQPEKAAEYATQAHKLLNDDSIDWSKFINTDKKAPMAGDNYVVINASMSVAEDFVPTPAKQQAISTANEKIKAGDRKGALETLNLAGVGIVENQLLMPLKQTQQHVTKALELIKSDKYYEANLSLKSAEDGLIVNTEAVAGVPMKAKAVSAAATDKTADAPAATKS